MRISVKVDGVRYVDDVEPRLLLVPYLREQAGGTGTSAGCDTSNCGLRLVRHPGHRPPRLLGQPWSPRRSRTP